MIAIHNSPHDFHPRWMKYCQTNNIPFKLVDCYANNIVDQVKDCSALMWHYHQGDPKANLVAKPLLFSLEQSGKKVFPDFNTAWHFDDKVGQKFLLEAINADLINSYVFVDKKEAMDWVVNTSFPKVFKLRGGAGSQNVRLVKTKEQAKTLVNKSFSSGFSKYNAWESLKERIRRYKLGKARLFDIFKGLIRFIMPPNYSKTAKEKGYVYFQDFIPNNSFDIRIIVIGNKAFGLKRLVRENDFRASGSGFIVYEREEMDERCVKQAFEVTKALKAQCVAFDFIFNFDNNPLIVEISYGFSVDAYDVCPGYWDDNLEWHIGKFNPYGWMVELLRNNP